MFFDMLKIKHLSIVVEPVGKYTYLTSTTTIKKND
jgi:hypothetical protein